MPSQPVPFRPQPLAPRRDGLYDPAFERDSCGVGFVARLDGRKSHTTVQSGLQLLRNLQHRGACGCDQDTGDGAGILLQMPDAFFRAEAERLEIELPPPGEYGVAFVFLPRKGLERTVCKRAIEAVVAEEGQVVLGWRTVPVVSSAIGWLARSQEPVMEQLLIGRGSGDSRRRGLRAIALRHPPPGRALGGRGEQPGRSPLARGRRAAARGRSSTRGCSSPTSSPSTSPTSPTRAWSRPWPSCTAATARTRSRSGAWPSRSTCWPTTARSTPCSGNVHWLQARQPRMKSRILGDDLAKVLPLAVRGPQRLGDPRLRRSSSWCSRGEACRTRS